MSNTDLNEAKQKRARSQLSCTACRQGKLRCNRATPCDQCIKRSKDSACSYLPPKTRSRGPQDVKSRIHHLEQLVVDLMNSRSSNDNATTTSSGRSNSTAVSVRESPSTLQSDSSRSATRDLFEADKTLPEVTPPYSEDGNSPIKQHQHEAPQQLDSFGHLRITRDGTRYVSNGVKSTSQQTLSGIPTLQPQLFYDIAMSTVEQVSEESLLPGSELINVTSCETSFRCSRYGRESLFLQNHADCTFHLVAILENLTGLQS